MGGDEVQTIKSVWGTVVCVFSEQCYVLGRFMLSSWRRKTGCSNLPFCESKMATLLKMCTLQNSRV